MPRKKRKCTGHGCENLCDGQQPFCGNCFGNLPRDIKTDLTTAWGGGNGSLLIETLEKARDFLRERHEKWKEKEMGKEPEVVDVDLDLLEERDKSFKVTDGEPDEQYPNSKRWIFLPKSLVENNGDGTFTMPLWMAKEKGLV